MSNRLTKIYTRTGDDGTTELSNRARIDKSDIRIDAMGDIDELNSVIGFLRANDIPENLSGNLLNIQHRLFDIGGELAIPGNAVISSESVKRLEQLIDVINSDLPALKEFVLPGGSISASICHIARTVCRRSERTLVALARKETFNTETLCYINRLSDLLFVVARMLNQEEGNIEVFWDSEKLKHSL